MSFQPAGTSCTEVLAKGPNRVTSVSAEGAQSISLCIHIEDVATGTDQAGLPLELRVTVGTVGASGTSRYSGILFTSAAGVTQISYRGDGTTFGTDTAVVTYEGGHAIAITSIEVLPAAGRVASRVVVDPMQRTIAANGTAADRQFASPATGTAIALQVQDWRGRGVNDQVMILRADRGRLAANPGLGGAISALCAGPVSPVIAVTSASTNILPSAARTMPGTVNFVVCADPDAEPGPIEVTVESVSGLVPPTTIALIQTGRPARLATTVVGDTVVAVVTDAAGHTVSDGVPLRFMIPSVSGVVSSACVVSRDGMGSTTVGLTGLAGTVLVVADYNLAGASATCAATGTEQLVATVSVSRLLEQPASPLVSLVGVRQPEAAQRRLADDAHCLVGGVGDREPVEVLLPDLAVGEQ